MARSALAENTSTTDLFVDDTSDLHRNRSAICGSRSMTFSHFSGDGSGTVVSERPQIEEGPPAWLVKMLAKPHVARPLKRAELRWVRRANGEVIVY